MWPSCIGPHGLAPAKHTRRTRTSLCGISSIRLAPPMSLPFPSGDETEGGAFSDKPGMRQKEEPFLTRRYWGSGEGSFEPSRGSLAGAKTQQERWLKSHGAPWIHRRSRQGFLDLSLLSSVRHPAATARQCTASPTSRKGSSIPRSRKSEPDPPRLKLIPVAARLRTAERKNAGA